MPILQLTKRNIDKLGYVTDGRIDYFDTELKGLFLRVGESSKVFYVKTECKDLSGKSKSVKAKIGRYGEITPEDARKDAPDIMKLLRAGKPANAERVPTLRDVYDRYIKDKPLAATTIVAYGMHVPKKFADWLDMNLVEAMTALTPEVVIDRHQQILEGSGAGAAGNSFRCLQAIFKYGGVLYPQYITRNPVKILTDAELWVRLKERTDCLEPEQFKQFYAGLLNLPVVHRDCYLLALYQGLRPNEAHTLKWQDVNIERKQAYIRHETEKSKCSYNVPLCKQSMEIITRRLEAKVGGCDFIFPSNHARSKTGHATLRAEILKDKTGLDLTVHGLRRTYITTGEKLRQRRQDINLLTGHIDSSITGKHYVQLGVEDLRITGQTIANEIERLMIHGAGAKVIDFPAARQAA
jgi:site-specific recombinase XerD